MNITYTSREQLEVYKFRWPIAIGLPVLALVLQAFLPVHFHFLRVFDVPLLVTIFFAVSRRNPLAGLSLGALIGLAQDSLAYNLPHHPIGVYGLAKTIIGYVASSLGVKIDVENPGTRFLMTYAFYVIHQAIFHLVQRYLIGDMLRWDWRHEALAGLANALLAVALFAVLDRTKERT